MIDPPPYASRALRQEGITPNLIDKVILTHCHADHDAGTFHKLIESSPVEFISTKTVLDSFLRKYSAQCEIPVAELRKLFYFRDIKIGHSYKINGAILNFEYSFHSIPCLNFTAEYQGKKFFLSGDTFYHPEKLKSIYDLGIFTEARYI